MAAAETSPLMGRERLSPDDYDFLEEQSQHSNHHCDPESRGSSRQPFLSAMFDIILYLAWYIVCLGAALVSVTWPLSFRVMSCIPLMLAYAEAAIVICCGIFRTWTPAPDPTSDGQSTWAFDCRRHFTLHKVVSRVFGSLSIISVLGLLLLLPAAMASFFADELVEQVGPFGYAPMLLIYGMACMFIGLIVRSSCNSEIRYSILYPRIFSRIGCVLYFASVLWCLTVAGIALLSLMVNFILHGSVLSWFAFFLLSFLIFATFAGLAFDSVMNYVRKRLFLRRALHGLDDASQSPGWPVGICLPILSPYGHFVLIVRDRKYELRMNRADRSVYYNTRPWRRGELSELQNDLDYALHTVGFTTLSEEAIDSVFKDIETHFGAYDPFHNNCRDFLHRAAVYVTTAKYNPETQSLEYPDVIQDRILLDRRGPNFWLNPAIHLHTRILWDFFTWLDEEHGLIPDWLGIPTWLMRKDEPESLQVDHGSLRSLTEAYLVGSSNPHLSSNDRVSQNNSGNAVGHVL